MNQILSMNMPNGNKNRNRGTTDTRKVIKIFAIILIIFAIFLVGTGIYSIYLNGSGQEVELVKPTISIENKTDRLLLLKVMGQTAITEINYRWNSEEEIEINGNNQKYVEREVDIPLGKNTLYVVAVDEHGQEISYEREYITQTNIKLEVVGNKILVSYESDKEIAYMTYKWDDGEENTININNTIVDEKIDVIRGLHELTVKVVDIENNEDVKVQSINGVSKPEIHITVDENREHFVIEAHDEQQLTKMEIRLDQDDEKKYVLNLSEIESIQNELTYTFPLELHSGANIIEVTVHNSDGLSEYSAAQYNK